jgi:phytanoyl-CoA hydroxylase
MSPRFIDMQASIPQQIDELRDQGYVIAPRFVPSAALAVLNSTSHAQLAARVPPLEFEADLRYPGAPESHAAVGGDTVRRLLDAYARAPSFAEVATGSAVREWMRAYFAEDVRMSRAHHNCLMTKHPRYGSMTGWHRDIRYWSFEREDLVSVWLALGEETLENGGLWLVPGSHRMTFGAGRFDEHKFFRAEGEENRKLLSRAIPAVLAPGDALFFHCNTLHSAGKNIADAVKFSLVFTYHGRSNPPRPGTRSASKPEIEL